MLNRLARAISLGLALLLITSLPSSAASAGTDHDVPPDRVAGVPVPDGQVDMAIARLDALAEEILAKSGIPGMAVAVTRGAQTVYAKGFGVRLRGEPARVDADTVFQIASVSKSVGSTVVASQVGKGVVAWDTPVLKHLPWFALSDPWVSAHVTIGDMFAHRSGLPDHAGDDLEDLGYSGRDLFERLRFLRLNSFRNSYAYTNMGLTVAAEAVAAAAAKDWATLSDETIYKPLGMDSTSSRFVDYANRGNRAYGHVKVGEGFDARYTRQPDAQSPAGGVSSSANDMARWMAMVLQNGRYGDHQIVDAHALLSALTPQIVSNPPAAADSRASFYGYGFGMSTEPSGRVTFHHSGAFLLGASATYLLIPSLDLGIVVLSNAAPTGAVEALSLEFADLVQYGEIKRDWYGFFSALFVEMERPIGELVGQPRPTNPKAPLALASYVGTYSNDYFGILTVAEQGGALVLTVGPDDQKYTLHHWDGNRFVFALTGENAPVGTLSAVDFLADNSGSVQDVTVEILSLNGMGTFRNQRTSKEP